METMVTITMPKQWYFPGEKIVGTISLEFGEDAVRLRELDLVMKGIEKTTAGSGADCGTERNEFYRNHVRIASFCDVAMFSSGVGSWSFAVTLPHDIPPSMKQEAQGQSWKVKYMAEVHLVKGRHLTSTAVKRRIAFGVKITPQGREQAQSFRKPAFAMTQTTPVARCLGFNRGSATVGFGLEKTAFDRGETVEIIVAVRNDSKLPIRGMTCELVQEAEWKAKKRTSRCMKVLSALDMPRFMLDACLVRRELAIPGRSRSLWRTKTVAEEQLSWVLQAREGWPLQVIIPPDATYGLEQGHRCIRLGRLKTYVQVHLEMDALCARPLCRYPITLAPGHCPTVEREVRVDEPIAVAVPDGESNTPTTPFVDTVFFIEDGVTEDTVGEGASEDEAVEDGAVDDSNAEESDVGRGERCCPLLCSG